MPPEITASLVLFALFIIFLAPNVKIIKEGEAAVVERLGAYLKVIDQPGIHFLFPLVDRIVQKESLLPMVKELSFEQDGYKDIYQYTYKITDIKMFCYAATEPLRIMEEQMIKSLRENHSDVEDLKEIVLNFGVELQIINKMN
jgi:hypothetical protein